MPTHALGHAESTKEHNDAALKLFVFWLWKVQKILDEDTGKIEDFVRLPSIKDTENDEIVNILNSFITWLSSTPIPSKWKDQWLLNRELIPDGHTYNVCATVNGYIGKVVTILQRHLKRHKELQKSALLGWLLETRSQFKTKYTRMLINKNDGSKQALGIYILLITGLGVYVLGLSGTK